VAVADGPITIGRPLPNTQMVVVNACGGVQPIGVAGEVLIGGAGLARGYLGRRDLDGERFVAIQGLAERLYRTGDIGYWSADGALVCLGRLDDQTKIRGFRVELGEIERQLLQLDWIQAATVVGDGPAAERRLVAYLVPADADEIGPRLAELRRALGQALPEYMIPSVFVPLDRLPLTPNGKVDKNALIAPAACTAVVVPPATATERVVVDVLGELLRLSEVSVEGDFFELGGHSLLGARLATGLNKKFDCHLGLKDIFELRTARNLSLHVDYLSLLKTRGSNPRSHHSAALQEEVEW